MGSNFAWVHIILVLVNPHFSIVLYILHRVHLVNHYADIRFYAVNNHADTKQFSHHIQEKFVFLSQFFFNTVRVDAIIQ